MKMRKDFLSAYHGAIGAVGGSHCVANWLSQHTLSATHLVAVGKASAAMAAGALQVLGPQLSKAVVITKADHLLGLDQSDPRLTCIESSHPVADSRSLAAGLALRQFFAQAPADAEFLLCISGGASALVDELAQGLDAAFLSRMNAWLLASGLPIDAMNRVRKCVSQIKGGRLAADLQGRAMTCLMISDVPGDDTKTIGSGLAIEHQAADLDISDLDLPKWLLEAIAAAPGLVETQHFSRIQSFLVARPIDACTSAYEILRDKGYPVQMHRSLLQGDAVLAGQQLVGQATATPGVVHIQSSETTVVLPRYPGQGGRCQALALSAAMHMHTAEPMLILAAGTDGTDGPGDVAGAMVDTDSIARGRTAGLDANCSLETADSGRFLSASGDLLRTGPTGTNVMDLIFSWHA